MRKVMLTMSAALVLAVSANAEMVEKTTTTRYSGTIAETLPSTSTIILKSEDSPKTVKYIYNDRTVWEDASGKTVRMETVRDQPATIFYEKQGDQMIVTRVITEKPAPPKVIEQRTTTTLTTEKSD
jgi:hypothetical protein